LSDTATISQILKQAIKQLSFSDSARLDSEILLLKVLNEQSDRLLTKTWLLTWPEKTLTMEQLQQFEYYLQLRTQGMPVAYITGEKDFWNLTLRVSPATLIPRPETELLVECALDKLAVAEPCSVLDMGTGSGAIALAIASERKNSMVLATDISQEALNIAQHNTLQLSSGSDYSANVRFCLARWFEGVAPQRFDVIVTNPPYIAQDDPELETNVKKFEPLSALYSGVDGLDDIRQIVQTSGAYLTKGGWLLMEHGYTQAQAIQSLLKQQGFTNITTLNDLNELPRVTQACWNNS
jgi:release factor glutamine methyltransferase